jgi:hypothetical protein
MRRSNVLSLSLQLGFPEFTIKSFARLFVRSTKLLGQKYDIFFKMKESDFDKVKRVHPTVGIKVQVLRRYFLHLHMCLRADVTKLFPVVTDATAK